MTTLVSPGKSRTHFHFNPMPVESLSRDKGQSQLLTMAVVVETQNRLLFVEPLIRT